MKYNHRQRMEMATYGVDADELENPKQSLPPLDERIKKLERYMKDDHPRSEEYKKKLEVYRTLKGELKGKKSWFSRFMEGLKDG